MRADDITASSPDEKDPFFAPGRRQGLPAPDVLRDPRRRPAHVSARPSTEQSTSTTRRTPTVAGRHRSTTTTRAGRSAPASRTRWPASTRRCPTASTPADLAAYCLMLGDDALVYTHRLSEWCSHAPELEEEVALANIALDLLGQARLLLAARPRPTSAGARARRRGRAGLLPRRGGVPQRRGWSSCTTATSPATIVRLLLFSTWRLALLRPAASARRDPVLAAVAAKGVKELAYHRDYAARWFAAPRRRHRRSRTAGCRPALDAVWPLRRRAVPHHRRSSAGSPRPGSAVDPATVRDEVDAVLDQVLGRGHADRARRAGRPAPSAGAAAGRACTPSTWAALLAEMQSLARAAPGGDVVTRVDAPPEPTRSARRSSRTVRRPRDADAHPRRPRRRPRRCEVDGDDGRRSTITPTYSGCPAMARCATTCGARWPRPGSPRVEVRTVLSPAWSTDWISARGRRTLAEHGIAAHRAGRAPRRAGAVDPARAPPTRRALPALRVTRPPRSSPVRADRLHRPASVPRVPRAVRAHEGDLMAEVVGRPAPGSTPCASPTSSGSATTSSPTFSGSTPSKKEFSNKPKLGTLQSLRALGKVLETCKYSGEQQVGVRSSSGVEHVTPDFWDKFFSSEELMQNAPSPKKANPPTAANAPTTNVPAITVAPAPSSTSIPKVGVAPPQRSITPPAPEEEEIDHRDEEEEAYVLCYSILPDYSL